MHINKTCNTARMFEERLKPINIPREGKTIRLI